MRREQSFIINLLVSAETGEYLEFLVSVEASLFFDTSLDFLVPYEARQLILN